MDSIRTSTDPPRQRSTERPVDEPAPERPQQRLNLDSPIVPLRGKPFDLTNEQIHDLIEFP